jgi:hypothetical protein
VIPPETLNVTPTTCHQSDTIVLKQRTTVVVIKINMYDQMPIKANENTNVNEIIVNVVNAVR